MTWDAPFERVVEAMMDIHHTPHAHRTWLSSVGALLSPYAFERRGDVICSGGPLRAHDAPAGRGDFEMTVELHPPMQLYITLGRGVGALVCLCPVGDARTHVVARSYVRVPIIGRLLAAIALFGDLSLIQPADRRMAENTLPAPGERHPDKLVRADGAIALYRRLLADPAEAAPRDRDAPATARQSQYFLLGSRRRDPRFR